MRHPAMRSNFCVFWNLGWPRQFGEEAVKEGMGGGGGGPADIFDLFGMGGGRRAPRERRSEDVVHK